MTGERLYVRHSMAESSATSVRSGIERKVDVEMTRLLYRSAGFGLFSNFVLALVLVAAALGTVPAGLNGGWLAAIVLVSVARHALNRAFTRADARGESLERWRSPFIAGVAVAGVIWGLAGWLYFPAEPASLQLPVSLILVGLNAGAARSLASVPVAFHLYVLTTLAPLCVRFATSPAGGWTLSFIAFTYALFLINTARLHHRELWRLWQLNFQHEEMVQTLNEARERADAANRAKSGFLATMSHEIRTPMNGIMGMLQVLEDSPLSADQRSQVQIATTSAESLMRLLNDILDFSKIESGKLEFELRPFSLRESLEEVVALLRAAAAAKGLRIELQSAGSLPEFVLGDSTRLKQVLINLAGNAVKFTACGGITVAATQVRSDARTAAVRFAVRDSGIGIDAATRGKLFQVFSQGDSSMSRRYGGSGLGLAISQRLVEHMGGSIALESTPGQGSEFSFELTFPIANAPAEPPAPAAPEPRALQGRVLVVEDDPVNQQVIQLMLSRFGLRSHVIADGFAAVQVALEQPWDLVIMDCQMPGLDGPEATRRIRRGRSDRSRPLPIIALTANARPEDRAASTAAGMDDFLTKPVRQEDLRACLARWLPAAPESAADRDASA